MRQILSAHHTTACANCRPVSCTRTLRMSNFETWRCNHWRVVLMQFILAWSKALAFHNGGNDGLCNLSDEERLSILNVYPLVVYSEEQLSSYTIQPIMNGFVLLYGLLTTFTSRCDALEFHIGALVSHPDILSSFKRMVSTVTETVGNELVKFKADGELLSLNALKGTEQVCNLFNRSGGRMFALIVSHPNGAIGAPPLSVSFTSSFYLLPTIGISARQSVFSDKYNHASFLRTVPPHSREAEIWADLVVAFGWREVCVIHSDDQDAKTLLAGLERASMDQKRFKLMRQVIINTDEEDAARVKDFVELLQPIRNEQTRVVMLFLRRVFAEYIFSAARELGMLDAEWAWVVSENALQASNIPQGVISARLLQSSEMDHIIDAVRVATKGILSLTRSHPDAMSVLRSVSACREDPLQINSEAADKSGQLFEWHDYAVKLYNHMLQVNFSDGRTGHVEFDRFGDRLRSVYEIVNTQHVYPNLQQQQQAETTIPYQTPQSPVYHLKRPDLVPIGLYGVHQPAPPEWYSDIAFPPVLSINLSSIVWPGNVIVRRIQPICAERDDVGNCRKVDHQFAHAAPMSFKKKTHLRVVTAASIPFVYTRPKTDDQPCNESSDPSLAKMEVECSHTDPKTGNETLHCCSGFCVDLLRLLANRTGLEVNPALFTYDLHLVGDGEIGEEIVQNDTRRWTGIMGEILTDQADLAVAPVSITPERVARADFSKPFKYLGMTILTKREHAKSNLGSFLQPFENTLWVLVALSVHAVAWVLYLMDRFSPYGLSTSKPQTNINQTNPGCMFDPTDKGAEDEKTEGLNLSAALYFAWGVLLNSGIGEGTPRSCSARVLGMVWAGFAMIIVASYTANLAAFLVLDRPESSISGIDDMRLRNPQKDFTFATVRGSSVDLYFKRQMEYSTMYRVMQSSNYASADEAIQAVKTGTLKAFIWDSARLNYEAASNCDLITSGDLFGPSGYGLVMKKGNPWLEELSQSVLTFHERGITEKLDSLWIHVNAANCERTESSPATLGLTNMAGVFILVVTGIISGMVITLIEIACARQRRAELNQIKTHNLVIRAFRRWRNKTKQHRVQPKQLL